MIKDRLAYIIAVVGEFAAAFSLTPQQAYRYLDRFMDDKMYNSLNDDCVELIKMLTAIIKKLKS